MKKLGLLIAMVCLSVSFVGPAQAATIQPGGVPFDSGSINICFGGANCGGANTELVLGFVPGPVNVGTIKVDANDNVGASTNAWLRIFADGVYLGEQDVKKAGSTLTFTVNRSVREISFRTRHTHNPGGDEVVVTRIRIP